MATHLSTQQTQVAPPNYEPLKANEKGGRVRIAFFDFLTTGHVEDDDVELCKIPSGARIIHGRIIPSATLGGTVTVAIGYTGDTGAYRAAATLTAGVDFANTIATDCCTETTAETTILATYAADDPVTALTVKGYILYAVS